MNIGETSRFVRLRVEVVVEVTDPDQLSGAALDHISSDESLSGEGRRHARDVVQEDPAESLAYLLDPIVLVRDVPGVEMAHASWSGEEVDHDPETVAWDMEDAAEEDDEDLYADLEDLHGLEGFGEEEEQDAEETWEGEGGAEPVPSGQGAYAVGDAAGHGRGA
ncbi:hypothetical protein [Streptomyces sp. NPDC003077]|uniref:hypothetical protein n=1 Tax=Streptomyces sp. NPDC003077 TaxID=3154443 RepID=UPI0033BB4F5B